MRLGHYPCIVSKGSLAYKAYGQTKIFERHRHRYEFNIEYRDKLVQHGMKVTGVSPDNKLIEIIELENHPWFLACQFHPELQSKPMHPHPIFHDFIKAALVKKGYDYKRFDKKVVGSADKGKGNFGASYKDK